jgi:RNA polymerase sigma factor (sigma-70 family)
VLLAEALNRLPAKFREVLFLFEIERWSYKAIAAALNVRVETVSSRLKSARRRMQQELTQVREKGNRRIPLKQSSVSPSSFS